MTGIATDWLLWFSACMAVPLLGRNMLWGLGIARAWAMDGKHTAMTLLQTSYRFKAPLIRAGTVCLCIASVAMLFRTYWLAALCIAILMGWRWIFFARQRAHVAGSMILMAALSTLAVMWSAQ